MPSSIRARKLTSLYALVGERLRERRRHLGLPLSNVAEQLGISQQQLWKYERGENRIDIGMLYQLARSLNVPVAFFYENYQRDGSAAVLPDAAAANDDKPDPQAAKLVSAWRAAPPEVRTKVLNLLTAMASGTLSSLRHHMPNMPFHPSGDVECKQRLRPIDAGQAAVQAYLFVFLGDSRRRQDAVARITRIPEIRNCEFLCGDIDMILRVEASRMTDLNRVRNMVGTLEGVAKVTTRIVLSECFARNRV
jgi:transcriptional regulator with XRE-family HTH domain